MPPSAQPPAGLSAVARQGHPNTSMPHVVYIATAGLLLLVVGIFAIMLLLQRRRRRAQILLALAAEDAERRRKKRKRAGLRSAEIERYCPELIVVPTGTLIRDTSDDDNTTDQAYTDVVDAVDDEIADLSKRQTSNMRLKEKQETLAEDVRSADSQPDEHVPLPIEIQEGNEMCVVCLDDMLVDQRVRRLPCSHVYHSSCIRLWLRRKNACPCCCKVVVKRKKRKKKKTFVALDNTTASGENIDAQPLPAHPAEPTRAASFSIGDVHRRERAARMFAQSRSMPCVDAPNNLIYNIDRADPRDRPRPIVSNSSQLRNTSVLVGTHAFPRNGSLLDPDDPNSEVLYSEASSHFDEHMANQLLDQVRQVIRGEIGIVDEYSTDGDMSDACLDFHEDDDSLLLDNVRLNNPFRGHTAATGLTRSTLHSATSHAVQRPGEVEENLTTAV